MLEHLSVRNFAILESVDIDFGRGMTVFSGETGAGKSLIVDALGFLLGGRADSSLIREGAQECSVAGLFSINNCEEARRWLKEKEIQPEEGNCVLLRRNFRQNGRGLAWIQDRPVSRSELAEFSGYLVDIHGQHEHQRLLDADAHGDMLDAFAGLETLRQRFSSIHAEWKKTLAEYRALLEAKEKRIQELDYLQFVIREISAAKPRDGEDIELQDEERKLSQYEKLYAAISDADGILSGQDEHSLLHGLKRIRVALEAARTIDASLTDMSDRLGALYYEAEDIATSIAAYRRQLRFDPVRLEAIGTRLAELQRLKRKYGPELKDVLARLEQAKQKAALLAHADEHVQALEGRLRELKETMLAGAGELSERRMEAGKQLASRVQPVLRRLGMPEARFTVHIERRKDEKGAYLIGPRGFDAVAFHIAPNPGEPEKPLIKIASGGELSRIALALKSVFAEHDIVQTLVFDEIDSGIGGQVGNAVGEYLRQLGSCRQVLCVTHLATIAAQADAQYKVAKTVVEGRTITSVTMLEGAEREEEIARMLSGSAESDTSRRHAAELLSNAAPRPAT